MYFSPSCGSSWLRCLEWHGWLLALSGADLGVLLGRTMLIRVFISIWSMRLVLVLVISGKLVHSSWHLDHVDDFHGPGVDFAGLYRVST